MLPTTGPIYDTIFSPSYCADKVWYRQKKPFNLSLPFSYQRGWAFGPGNLAYPGDSARWRNFASEMGSADAYEKAYSKLVQQLGEPGGLGITLTQWRQADEMISRRGKQLIGFAGQLLKRSPAGVAASLGLSLRDVQAIMRTRYGVARSLSDLWLEFWFGWKPLVDDIHTACEVFDRDVPWGRYRAVREIKTPSGVVQPPNDAFSEGIVFSKRAKVSLGIDVRIKNPNVRLMQQFGLLNVGQIAWDAVPWSFVFDWFANLNSWLGSFTDFAGLETSNGYVKSTCEVAGSTYWPAYPEKGGSGRGLVVNRVVVDNLPRPQLGWKELSLKPTRALTAITLLTQKLPSRGS